jgi:hypothetical protein
MRDMRVWQIEIVELSAEAANESWLAFPPRQEVTITRLGEYTRVVLTKFGPQTPPVPQPVWA